MAKKYKIKISDDVRMDEDDKPYNQDIEDADYKEYRRRSNRANGLIEREGKTVEQYYNEYPDEETFERKKAEQKGRLIKDKPGSIMAKLRERNGRS